MKKSSKILLVIATIFIGAVSTGLIIYEIIAASEPLQNLGISLEGAEIFQITLGALLGGVTGGLIAYRVYFKNTY